MILNQLINNDFYFNAPLKITKGDVTLLDTRETGWNDVPYDIMFTAIEEITTDDNAIKVILED